MGFIATTNTTMSGYICCFSNASMPGILFVLASYECPAICLSEVNISALPTPYRFEVSKKIATNLHQKEKSLHHVLEQNSQSSDLVVGFYRVSLIEVNAYLDLMDGEPASL